MEQSYPSHQEIVADASTWGEYQKPNSKMSCGVWIYPSPL
jgi:hypothetical protein